MDKKFLCARDVILAFLKAQNFTPDEMREVLQMCNDEVAAWKSRAKITEIKKEDEE